MSTNLKPGDKAPEFETKDQDGNLVKLSDFVGKKVVLYFYPKDDTKGCTAQACNLRDHHESLKKAGYVILGVSKDDEKSHQKFIKKYELPFTLLADTDTRLNELYGVWKEKKMYGKSYMGTQRTTFVIDEQGIVSQVISEVNTGDHSAQILESAS